MAEGSFTGVVDSLMKGMETVLSSKTVVGEATHIGDTIVVPLMDVTFGIGAGASEGSGSSEKKKDTSGTGGLGGMTAKMTPCAVLVIKDGQTKLINIKNQDTITKLLDLVPDLIDKFKSMGGDGDDDFGGLDIDVSVGKDKKSK